MDLSTNAIFLGMIAVAVLGALYSLWAWSKEPTTLIELNNNG